MTGRTQIFYFAPQYSAVMAMLEGLGCFPQPLQLHPVTLPRQLAGLRPGCTFIHITNHGRQLPPEILEAAHVHGLIDVAINDEWMRQRHHRRPFAEPPYDPSYERPPESEIERHLSRSRVRP